MSQPVFGGTRTVMCGRCRAAIPLVQLAPAVQCPYCGSVQPLDSALLEELQAHQQTVQGHLRGIEAAQERQAGVHRNEWLTKLYGSRPAQVIGLLLMLVMIGGPVICAGQDAGAVRFEKVAAYLAYGAALAGLLATIFWRGRRKRVSALGTAAAVACPNCGASQPVAPGQVLERCAFCGAPLIPSAEAQRRLEEAAADAHRRARMDARRAERQAMADGASRMRPYGVLNPLVLGCSLSALLPVIFLVLAVGRGHGAESVALVLGAMLAVLAVPFGHAAWTLFRRNRLRTGLAELVAGFGGQSLHEAPSVARWLNLWWDGPFEVRNLLCGEYHVSGALTVEGYPTLIHIDLTDRKNFPPPRALILMACSIPAAGDATRPPSIPHPAQQLLAQFGAADCPSVMLVQTGIQLELGASFRQGLFRPGAFRHIAALLPHLVRLAQALGAPPGSPVP